MARPKSYKEQLPVRNCGNCLRIYHSRIYGDSCILDRREGENRENVDSTLGICDRWLRNPSKMLEIL